MLKKGTFRRFQKIGRVYAPNALGSYAYDPNCDCSPWDSEWEFKDVS